MNVDRDVELLIQELQRFGGPVKFGVLCRDERFSNTFEALGGTLKAAKKRNLIDYDSELLLQGPHDDVMVYLVDSAQTAAAAASNGDNTQAAAQPAAAPEAGPAAAEGNIAGANSEAGQRQAPAMPEPEQDGGGQPSLNTPGQAEQPPAAEPDPADVAV